MVASVSLANSQRATTRGAVAAAAFAMLLITATLFDGLEHAILAPVLGVLMLLALANPLVAIALFAASIPLQEMVTFSGPIASPAKGWGALFALSYLLAVRGRIAWRVIPLWGWLWIYWALASLLWALEVFVAETVSLLLLFATAVLVADASLRIGRRFCEWTLIGFSVGAGTAALVAISRFVSNTDAMGPQRSAAFEAQSVAHFSSYMLVLLVFSMFKATDGAANRRVRSVFGVAAVISVVGLIISGTRSSWVAGAIALLPILARLLRRRGFLIIPVAVAVVTIGIASAVPSLTALVGERVETGNSDILSQFKRDDIWRVGIEMVREHPMLGVGLRSFPLAFHDARGRAALASAAFEDPGIFWGAHSIYIGITAELGLVGILLFASFIWTVLRRSNIGGFPGAIHAILVALLIQGAFLDILNRKPLWLVLGLAAGIGARTRRDRAIGVQEISSA